MGDIVFDVAKGRVVELWNNVKTDNPVNATLTLVLLASTGLEADTVLEGKLTLADVLSGTTNEATNTGYSRIDITTAMLPALPAPDTVNHRRRLPLPDQTWPSVQNDGTGVIGKLLVCYDPDVTAGTDADIIPLTAHDFPKTPDGTAIVTDVDANGFYQAAKTCP